MRSSFVRKAPAKAAGAQMDSLYYQLQSLLAVFSRWVWNSPLSPDADSAQTLGLDLASMDKHSSRWA